MTKHEISERFRWLARLGHDDLVEIFPKKLLSQIRTELNPGSGTVLEIVSRDFLFPWELLYDTDEDDAFGYENFWGFKYVI